MKAIVTGGAGFIGHHLTNLLLSKGYDVEVWDNLSTGLRQRVPLEVTFRQLDLTYDVLPDIKADVVFHLAAPVSVQESLENPYKYEQGCFMATKRTLDWALKQQVMSFVMASTSAIYGDAASLPAVESQPTSPMSPYAEWKLAAEQLLASYHRHFKIHTAALRLFNVYGEGQPSTGSYAAAVAKFMKSFEAFEPITVTGDGLQTRDYIYVKDVVRAFELAATPAENFKLMNVGTGEEVSVLEIAETFGGEIKHIEARKEPRRSVADISRISSLGWKPSETVLNWINQNK